jgi:hypothetical protein
MHLEGSSFVPREALKDLHTFCMYKVLADGDSALWAASEFSTGNLTDIQWRDYQWGVEYTLAWHFGFYEKEIDEKRKAED